MLLTNIKGENVLQYPTINIDFTEGFYNINGVNGAGKSSIMDFVDIGLFGSTSKYKATEIKYDQAKKSQKWWLEVSFKHNGNEYTVYRHENTAKAKLSVNGKILITGGQTEVTNHIVNSVLRMGQTSFLNAFYAKQDEFDNLMKLSPEKRKKEISRLLKADKIDDSIANLRKDKNKLETVIDEQSRHIKGNEYFEAIEKELSSSLTLILENQTNQENIVKDKENGYKKILNEKEKLDSKYEKYQGFQSSYREKNQEQKTLTEMTLNNIQSELKDIQKSKNEFSQLQADVERYDGLLLQLQQMQQIQVLYVQKRQKKEHMEMLKSRLTSKKDRIDNLKSTIPSTNYLDEIQQIETNITQLEEEIVKINNDVVELRSELTYVTNEGKRLKQERHNIQELGSDSPCPICKRAMGDHFHTLANDYGKNLEDLASQHKNLSSLIQQNDQSKLESQSKITSLKQQKLKLENEQRKVTTLNDELKMLQRDFQIDKKDFLNVQNQLEDMKDVSFDEQEFKSLSDEVNQLQKKKERFNYLSSMIAKETKLLEQEKDVEDKIKILINELKEIEAKVKELSFNVEEYKTFQNRINLEVNELRKAERELSFINEQRKNIEVRFEHLEKERNENKEKISELENRKREFALLLKSEEILKNYKTKRLSTARPRIERIMQELLTFITDGKYDLVEVDEQYNVFVYRNGIRKPINLYSGGEQKLFALCMRLAISRVISTKGEHKNFDYLALDEVLSSMDEGRQETIINALRKLSSVFKQIFMITHNSNIKGLFDGTLQVEQNTDLSSRAFWTTDTDDEDSEIDLPIAN